MTFNPSSSSDPSQEVARFSRWALILHTESQSRIAQHQIDVDGIDQSVGLYRKDNQWCFTQTSESRTCPGEVIAKIDIQGSTLSLQVYTDNVSLQAPWKKPGRIGAYRATAHHLTKATHQHVQAIVLRPGDSVDFRNLKLRLTLETEDDLSISSDLHLPYSTPASIVSKMPPFVSPEEPVHYEGDTETESQDERAASLWSPPQRSIFGPVIEETQSQLRKADGTQYDNTTYTDEEKQIHVPGHTLDCISPSAQPHRKDIHTGLPAAIEGNLPLPDPSPNLEVGQTTAIMAVTEEDQPRPESDIELELPPEPVLPSTALKRKTSTPTSSAHSSKRIKAYSAQNLALAPAPNKEEDDEDTTSKPRATSPRVVIPLSSSPSSAPTSRNLVQNPYQGPPPAILHSVTTVFNRVAVQKFLKDNKTNLTESMSAQESNFLCVNGGKLKPTVKLLTSVILGKTIVTERWVLDSVEAGFWLDPEPYLPEELRGKLGHDRKRLFAGKTIYVTPTLANAYSPWKEVRSMLRKAGPREVVSTVTQQVQVTANTIIFGHSLKDPAVQKLRDAGHRCFTKDLIPASIISGTLDLDSDEFLLE